jgi:anhydro-N-acetylmuramic acid kinase
VLRDEPYFAAPTPKSTGRELFSLAWLDRHLVGRTLDPVDVQATLAELTAGTIAEAIRASSAASAFLCGGGAHNADLVHRIGRALPRVTLATTDALGIAVDHVEAVAFAWLARETLAGRPGNLPAVTGAQRPGVLGGLWLPD